MQPPYLYRGTLGHAIQSCPYADADERLTALCAEHYTDTASHPEADPGDIESRLRQLCSAGVPDSYIVSRVLDCQDVGLLIHDCETWRRLSWHDTYSVRDGEDVYILYVVVEEWTGEWADVWEPLDGSEEIPANADWESPEPYRQAEDILLNRLGLTRDDLTDETSCL